MQPLVAYRMVFPPMDPVDAVICERQETGGTCEHLMRNITEDVKGDSQEYREEEVTPSVLADIVVEFRMTAHLTHEPWQGEDDHAGEGPETACNLKPDLILEEPRVLHHVFVEDVVIREPRKEEVQDVYPDDGDGEQRNDLSWQVISRPRR